MSIKKILMKRDGLTESEAVALMNETREAIYDAIAQGDFNEAESLMYDDLGLEMDYVFELLV